MPAPPACTVRLSTTSLAVADESLVGLAVDGDTSAFGALLFRHGPAMLAVTARILGSAIAADDAVQEAFAIAWKRLPQLRERTHVRGWLIQIATHQALNHLRRRRRDVPFPRSFPSSSESGPEAVALRNAQLTDLSLAVGALTTVQRECWVLREVEQMRYLDIAHTTGLTTGQVRGNIARARISIKTRMQDWR